MESAILDRSMLAMLRTSVVLCGALLLLSACGEKDVDASGDTGGEPPIEGDACDPEREIDEDEEAPACADDLSCEASGDTHVCAAPVEIHGVVLDVLSEEPIEGAHVTALDGTGSPVGSVSISDEEGRYAILVRAARNEDGTITDTNTWTLFATAADYEPFPSGLRPAIPVNSADAMEVDADDDDEHGRWVIDNPSTHVTLLILPSSELGGRTVSGVVHGEGPGGTLVVAEGSNPSQADARYAIADGAGHYTVFNVPGGPHTMVGYRRGLDVQPARIDGDADVEEADLEAADAAADAFVGGAVNIVNAPGGSETSVVLVPVSVYDEGLERGPVPLGLRAPQAPQVPSIAGQFEIDGVPPGRYKVLAAFENDLLVRDPDTGIAGTAIVEIEVSESDVALPESFKVTEHLAVVSPGREVPEVVMGTPTFVFADDASEDRYEVIVLDAYGELVWENREVPGVSGSDVVEVEYGGPALEAGQYYQFRATSIRENPNASSAISRTEDLRGVFIAG